VKYLKGGFPSFIYFSGTRTKPQFKKSEMHGDLPVKLQESSIETACLSKPGTAVSASKAPRRGALKIPKQIGGEKNGRKTN